MDWILKRGACVMALAASLATAACGAPTDVAPPQTAGAEVVDPSDAGPQVVQRGNGVENYIALEGVRRFGDTLVFPEVKIADPGFLVVHPFKDGVPVGTVYTGATALTAGITAEARIALDPAPKAGDPIIVMLHSDANRDGVFDFGDGVTVPDGPVFEDGVMIALRATTPLDADGITDIDIRQSFLEHAARAQLHRWWLFYEDARIPRDVQVSLVTPGVRVSTPSDEISGVGAYIERLDGFARADANAHRVTDIAYEHKRDGSTRVRATIDYHHQSADTDGAVSSARLDYDVVFSPTYETLPQVSEMTITRQGPVEDDTFRDAYVENRMASLVHYWMALIEAPDRFVTPFQEILAPSFLLNFTSGSISDLDTLQDWLMGPASSVVASRHDLSPLQIETVGPDAYRIQFEVDWMGIARDNTFLGARTAHDWTVRDDPEDRFARIGQVDVEILKPFAPIEQR